jgi:hypothetical protein
MYTVCAFLKWIGILSLSAATCFPPKRIRNFDCGGSLQKHVSYGGESTAVLKVEVWDDSKKYSTTASHADRACSPCGTRYGYSEDIMDDGCCRIGYFPWGFWNLGA